jgi:hypothetical protein
MKFLITDNKPDLTKESDNSLLKDNLRNNIISTDQPWQSVSGTTTPPIEKYGMVAITEFYLTI